MAHSGESNPYLRQVNVRSAVQRGTTGAVSSAHPLATEAAVAILRRGGNAVDAAIAAHAVISVVMPHAAGIGGDLLALVCTDGSVTAINGVGRSPSQPPATWASDGGSSVTVPGMVPAWFTMHEAFGRMAMEEVLQDAVRVASDGHQIDDRLHAAGETQRERLIQYGGGSWPLLALSRDDVWRQPQLANLLAEISRGGLESYHRAAAAAMADAIGQHGGTLSVDDIRAHATTVAEPISTNWGERTLWVQPPTSQGILLAMAARWLDARPDVVESRGQHVLIELANAVFAHRQQAAAGAENFALPLEVDLERASNRNVTRAYLHTAGVAVADSDGMVVSSLISVFDDFGSAVFVPELGIVLNNRAAGFTTGANAPRPNAFPVHTLAPAMITGPDRAALALATPGADGQVQTLLQILARMRFDHRDLGSAIAAPRWRSQEGRLLIEDDHPAIETLMQLGHNVEQLPAGKDIFGGVVAAGYEDRAPFAASDWRRTVTTGSA